MFYVNLRTVSQCNLCSRVSEKKDISLGLNLYFPQDSSTNSGTSISIPEMIKYYLRQERLEGQNQYLCEKCSRQDGRRFFDIDILPPYLMLQLNRFAQVQNRAGEFEIIKLCNKVELDDQFRLSDVLNLPSKERDVQY